MVVNVDRTEQKDRAFLSVTELLLLLGVNAPLTDTPGMIVQRSHGLQSTLRKSPRHETYSTRISWPHDTQPGWG